MPRYYEAMIVMHPLTDLLKDVGKRPVRYGAISVAEPMNAFDNSPQFSDETPLAEQRSHRYLALADPQSTDLLPPLPGQRHVG